MRGSTIEPEPAANVGPVPTTGRAQPHRISARVLQADRKEVSLARWYKAGLVLAMAGLFTLVSFTQNHLNVSREKLGLTRVAPLENAPPMLAFTTVALGGFRGLIANMLWLRATDLQEEDKYFEMVQLSDWITKLQPHIVTVWVHLAWNMAYNISIKFNDPKDRWPWVRRGIELLRDEALKYNPNEVLIYRELAWFFQHKMGADLDDAHGYYKYIWVQDMDHVLGRGRIDWPELLNPQTPETKEKVNILRERYKMNPEWMKEVDDRYGPLEWHLPETHAIYWAYLALEKTDKKKLKKDDLVQCRRVIFQSMQLAFRRGRLVYPDKSSDKFIYAPNLDIVQQANKAYLEMMDFEEDPNMKNNIGNAHKNFLKWATYYLYVYGRKTDAGHWWKVMHERYPKATPEGQDLEEYALDRAQETVGETSHDDAEAVIEGFIKYGYYYMVTDDDPSISANYFLFAKKFRDRFQEAVTSKSVNRVGLPELDKIKDEVRDQLLAGDPNFAAILRTKLGMPPASPESTNNPPTNLNSSTNAPPTTTRPAAK
jgi:hypothetical protein